MLTWLRELAETVGTFDRSALEPGYALRCTVGVAIPLVVAALLGQPALGVAAAVGAFITGFTSLQGVYRTRLQAILIAALGMALTSFIGALAAHSTPGIVAATAVAGYACGTIGQIGPAAATVALNSFVAFVLFSSQALAPEPALVQSGLVLGGGLIQALLLLIVWPTAHLDAERTALADVYANLAAYARQVSAGSPALPPITPFATARQILADPQPFARSAERARAERLLEDSELIRTRLGALATAHGVPPEIAGQLDLIAAMLRGERKADDVDLPAEAGGPADLGAHLRDALLAAAVMSSGRLPNVHLLSKPRPGPYVENRISWFSRESLRFSLVLTVAMVLARHFSADRGYWIPMTAALVLKPDFQATFVRGAGRIAGTLLGAVVASAALVVLRGNGALEIGGVLLAAAVAYLTFNPNYALFTVAITSFVVLVLSMRGLPGTTTIDVRVLDTLGGGALAMIGYLVMPTWERKRTRALLADLLDAQRGLSDAILRAYLSPTERSRNAIESARTAVWQVRTAVEASIDRTRHEPHRPHTIGAAKALRILSATQRYALINFALETALDEPRPTLTRADGAFADALDERMHELATALRDSHHAPPGDRLASATAAVAGDDFFHTRLRGYADAAERVARLVGTERTSVMG
ncbi:MAG TPA: FUSC family protein [Candidatus Cybelea sp.]|nr:FUSC family protein [Candidatus Cybelea sp.]